MQKGNAYRALTRVSDSNLAERIKDRILKATRSSTDWAVGVWQECGGRNRQLREFETVLSQEREIKEDGVSAELASRSGNVVTFRHCNVNINNFNV